MPSSVMNGAIGKSPLIDKMNQMPVGEVKSKTAMQMEQKVFGNETVKYQPVSISFPECRREMKEQFAERIRKKVEQKC